MEWASSDHPMQIQIMNHMEETMAGFVWENRLRFKNSTGLSLNCYFGGLVAINFSFSHIYIYIYIILGFDYHPLIDEIIFFRGVAQPPTRLYMVVSWNTATPSFLNPF